MKTKVKNLTRGFTIIEVMIVLAIAGLILAIVFIAVPQLQRNARDNQRQNIVTRVKAEMDTYASNNQGLYPFNTAACTGNPATDSGKICDFVTRYITGKVNVTDPSSGSAVLTGASASTGQPQACSGAACANNNTTLNGITQGQFYVIYGAKCQGQGVTNSGGTALTTKAYAVLIGLDRSGTLFCVDNG